MAQTAAVKQSKANARAQKQLGHNTWRKAFMQHYWLYIMMLPALLYPNVPESVWDAAGETARTAWRKKRIFLCDLRI